MKSLVKNIPTPIVGLILSLAALGNLVQSYGDIYRTILGSISAVLFLLVLLKIVIYPNIIKEDLKNPVIASVFPTLTMAAMLLSTYFKTASPEISFAIWIIAVSGHIALLLKFSFDHVLDFDLKKVFPSWFIVYVGIIVGSVTAPAFEMQLLGKLLFWTGFISYFLVLPLVLKRVSLKNMPQPTLPTLAIFAAPVALCLAGYMSSFETKNIFMVWFLLILSQLSYVFVLSQLPKILKLKFYPSFSALTFPLVISAISLKLTNGYLVKIGQPIPILNYIVRFEEIIAVLMVIFVLLKYIEFTLSQISQGDRLNVSNQE